MDIQKEIINKVAGSNLITFDLADLYPQGERIVFDIKEHLFQGLLLREKDFREMIKNADWSKYQDQHVAIICSSDAIVPTWAYMLLANKLSPYVKTVIFGGLDKLESILFDRALAKLDMEPYRDQRVVVKGCGEIPVPISSFVELTAKLSAVAKSIMYGEPCSTVPIFKRKD